MHSDLAVVGEASTAPLNTVPSPSMFALFRWGMGSDLMVFKVMSETRIRQAMVSKDLLPF